MKHPDTSADRENIPGKNIVLEIVPVPGKKRKTMIIVTIFFSLLTIMTFSGIILWQTNFFKADEQKVIAPAKAQQHPDSIVISK